MSEIALSAENEARLRAVIAANGLDAVADLIVRHSVECAVLTARDPDDGAEIGTSRYGGEPDLPESLEWPLADYGDPLRPLEFLMQINLEDVPPYVGRRLPARGMLYAFVDEWEVTVLYAGPGAGPLSRTGPPYAVSEASYDELKPHRIDIEAAIDIPGWYSAPYEVITDALQETAPEAASDLEDRFHDLARELLGQGIWAGKLEGQPCWIGYTADWVESGDPPSPQAGWKLLWTLSSHSAVNALYGDAGYLQVYVPEAALTTGDFGEVVTELESS